MPSIIIGTAGHIDHGKSAMVAALTGKDPDRLPEEKRRGITIDLGFADLQIGDVSIGFVDVPGHERFIKNMLAGAHGIDAVALVIAADEGVMPQTREHFDICRLLGIKNGLIVITKADLAEPELVELVREEVTELVSGSFLEESSIVCFSAKTEMGLEDLRQALHEVALKVPERPSSYVARLPVDRVFTMKGFGAVVTGTLASGEINEGDELELLPIDRRVRARGLQVHGKTVPGAVAGNRTAINLGGVDVAAIERGMVLAPVGRLRSSQVVDVEVTVLRDAPRPLRSRARVRLHAHAAEILGRVRVLNESGVIESGTSGFAQIRLEAPVVAVSGDRFILRSYSPSMTIAGGEVLDPFATKHRGREFDAVNMHLEKLRDLDQRVSAFVAGAGENGLRTSDLVARTGWTDKAVTAVVNNAVESGAVTDCDGVFIATTVFAQLSGKATDELKRHHEREPLARGLSRETLRERRFTHVQPEVFRAVLDDLERRGLLVTEKEIVRLREHTLEVSGQDAALLEQLVRLYREGQLAPPSLDEAFAAAGLGKNQTAHGRKVLQLLIDRGELVRVQGDWFFERDALNRLKARLKQYGDMHEPERLIDVAAFKDLAGVSRKYAIPLLEYFDRERITRRAGDRRLIMR
jgi:selenocysteine-specific elongation factor